MLWLIVSSGRRDHSLQKSFDLNFHISSLIFCNGPLAAKHAVKIILISIYCVYSLAENLKIKKLRRKDQTTQIKSNK